MSNDTVKIDDNVPVPASLTKHAHTRRQKWPWDELVVGQSFVLGGMKTTSARCRTTEANIRHIPRRFACSEVVEDGKKVMRVWRTQ
jgi:hypothetical protein